MASFLKIFLSLCLLVCLCLVNSSCKDDEGGCSEEPYPLLGNVALEALRDPAAFDDYIAQNRDQLNGQFEECLQQRIALFSQLSNEEKDRCDETFVFGSDFWHDCIEDVEQQYDNPIIFMSDIMRAINGTPFLQTDYGALLALYKQLDPALYNQVVQLSEQALATVNDTCEICD